jgi:hypothetical protein
MFIEKSDSEYRENMYFYNFNTSPVMIALCKSVNVLQCKQERPEIVYAK